jgi:ankyrin repeat protein
VNEVILYTYSIQSKQFHIIPSLKFNIKYNNAKALKKLFNSQSFDILKWRNSKGCNILHIATLYSNLTLLDTVIERIKLAFPSGSQEFSDWLNMAEANENFNALHFAVMRGDMRILKLLISLGVDYQKKVKDGRSVLHIAAQCDLWVVLHMFVEKFNMSLLDVDQYDRTPLHDACRYCHYKVWVGSCADIHNLKD